MSRVNLPSLGAKVFDIKEDPVALGLFRMVGIMMVKQIYKIWKNQRDISHVFIGNMKIDGKCSII